MSEFYFDIKSRITIVIMIDCPDVQAVKNVVFSVLKLFLVALLRRCNINYTNKFEANGSLTDEFSGRNNRGGMVFAWTEHLQISKVVMPHFDIKNKNTT